MCVSHHLYIPIGTSQASTQTQTPTLLDASSSVVFKLRGSVDARSPDDGTLNTTLPLVLQGEQVKNWCMFYHS
jgi:hypothetical protein